MKQQNGFTLVELAIVLMIIGLLVGGILRGQELLENSRNTALIQQVKSYQGAWHSFVDSYGNLPGDMSQASNRIPGCTAANFCGNGNGDNRVGKIGNLDDQTGSGATVIETSYFWKHLALAHLISGINPSADPANPVWGTTHPISKAGGGFTIFYSNSSGDFGTGHILRLQLSITQATGASGKLVLSPIRARIIDLKMDNGMPNTGDVTADWMGSKCDTDGADAQYLNLPDKNCIMYFNIS